MKLAEPSIRFRVLMRSLKTFINIAKTEVSERVSPV